MKNVTIEDEYNKASDNRADESNEPIMPKILFTLFSPACILGLLCGALLTRYVLIPLIFH